MSTVLLNSLFINPPSEDSFQNIKQHITYEKRVFTAMQCGAALSAATATALIAIASFQFCCTSPLLFSCASIPGAIVIALISQWAFSYYQEWRRDRTEKIESLVLFKDLSLTTGANQNESMIELVPLMHPKQPSNGSIGLNNSEGVLDEQKLFQKDASDPFTTSDILDLLTHRQLSTIFPKQPDPTSSSQITTSTESKIQAFKKQFFAIEPQVRPLVTSQKFQNLCLNQKRFCALRLVEHIVLSLPNNEQVDVNDWIPPDEILENLDQSIDQKLARLFLLFSIQPIVTIAANVLAFKTIIPALAGMNFASLSIPFSSYIPDLSLLVLPSIVIPLTQINSLIARTEQHKEQVLPLIHFQICQVKGWLGEVTNFDLSTFETFLNAFSEINIPIPRVRTTSLVQPNDSKDLNQDEKNSDIASGIRIPEDNPINQHLILSKAMSTFPERMLSEIYKFFAGEQLAVFLPEFAIELKYVFFPTYIELGPVKQESIPRAAIVKALAAPSFQELSIRQKYFWSLKLAKMLYTFQHQATRDNGTLLDFSLEQFACHQELIANLIHYQKFTDAANQLISALESNTIPHENYSAFLSAIYAKPAVIDTPSDDLSEPESLDGQSHDALSETASLNNELRKNDLPSASPPKIEIFVDLGPEHDQVLLHFLSVVDKLGKSTSRLLDNELHNLQNERDGLQNANDKGVSEDEGKANIDSQNEINECIAKAILELRTCFNEFVATPLHTSSYHFTGTDEILIDISEKHPFTTPNFLKIIKGVYSLLFQNATLLDLSTSTCRRIAYLIHEHTKLYAEAIQAKNIKNKLDDRRTAMINALHEHLFKRIERRLELLQFFEPKMKDFTLSKHLVCNTKPEHKYAVWNEKTSQFSGSLEQLTLLDDNPIFNNSFFKSGDPTECLTRLSIPFLSNQGQGESVRFGFILKKQGIAFSFASFAYEELIRKTPEDLDKILTDLVLPPINL